MANDSTVLPETDLFSTMSKHEDSWKDRRERVFNHSKPLRKIDVDQMLKTQNTNAPGLFNILKRKFHRSKKSKNKITDQFFETPISRDGSSGRWMIHERTYVDPSIGESLHHYQYDIQPANDDENMPEDFISVIKSYYTNNRSEEMEIRASTPLARTLEPVNEDLHILSSNSASKRAQSASARTDHRQIVSSNTTKRRSESTKKKKSKYYQAHQLNPQEIELRQALRLIDLDNLGFFSPNQFHRVLKNIGIHSNTIEKLEQCLPLDDDGHYSMDNLIKLLLG